LKSITYHISLNFWQEQAFTNDTINYHNIKLNLCEVDHSAPSNADVCMWSSSFTPPHAFMA